MLRFRSRKIFVSYRRSDTPDIAQRLYERLSLQFGAVNVFFDRADIEYGQLWREEVTRQIRAADIVIALVGPKWLETLRARAKGDDVLRFELATALTHKKQIIPVLVGATPMPHTGQLPQEVQRLTEFQALPISDDIEPAMLELLGRVKPGLGLAVSWTTANFAGWLVGILVMICALMLVGVNRGGPQPSDAVAFKIIGCVVAGALLGACVAIPQWLVLRPWFERARFLVPVYVVLSALGAGVAFGSTMLDHERGVGAAALMMFLVPIALTATLWWTVNRQLIYGGWWSTANMLAPIVGFAIAGVQHSSDAKTEGSVNPTTLSGSVGAIIDLLLPVFLLSLATGVLLVWLMRISEVKRR